jgi:hypothetical protein
MSRFLVLAALGLACTTAPAPTAALPAEPAPAEAPTAAETASATPGWDSFGEPFAETAAIPLRDALARAAELDGKDVIVEGRVSEVCQKAGCWMVLSDEERHVRVLMKDHAFSVDKQGAGRAGQVQGVLASRQVDPSEVAHYAEETRDGGVVPERVVEGPSYEIVASAVRLKRD